MAAMIILALLASGILSAVSGQGRLESVSPTKFAVLKYQVDKLTELIDKDCPEHFLKNALGKRQIASGSFAWEYRILKDTYDQLKGAYHQCMSEVKTSLPLTTTWPPGRIYWPTGPPIFTLPRTTLDWRTTTKRGETVKPGTKATITAKPKSSQVITES